MGIGQNKLCKGCMSPHRYYIDEQILNKTPYPAIIKWLAEKGETFSPVNLSHHKKHVLKVDKHEDARAEAIAGLKEEAAKVPATLAAPYFILIQFLEQVAKDKVSAGDAIRAAEAITKITGMRTQQALLLDYMERRFSRLEASAPIRGELTRMPQGPAGD